MLDAFLDCLGGFRADENRDELKAQIHAESHASGGGKRSVRHDTRSGHVCPFQMGFPAGIAGTGDALKQAKIPEKKNLLHSYYNLNKKFYFQPFLFQLICLALYYIFLLKL